MRWSVKGANNLAKALYRKENKELVETIERYTDGLVFTMQMKEIIETLSASKAPKRDGKGNKYKELAAPDGWRNDGIEEGIPRGICEIKGNCTSGVCVI